DLAHARAQGVEHAAEEVVRRGPRGRHAVQAQLDVVRLHGVDPDGEVGPGAAGVLGGEDDDRRTLRGLEDAEDLHARAVAAHAARQRGVLGISVRGRRDAALAELRSASAAGFEPATPGLEGQCTIRTVLRAPWGRTSGAGPSP